jgi:hypothetical protein
VCSRWGISQLSWQDAVCSDDAVRVVDQIGSNRRSLQRQLVNSSFGLCITVSSDSVRETDVKLEPARYRGDAWRQIEQTLRDGLAKYGVSPNVGRPQRIVRLRYLGRRSSLVAQVRTQTLQRYRSGRLGFVEGSLCARRNEDRPLLEPVRLGPISQGQGFSQAVHVARSARRNPCSHPYHPSSTPKRIFYSFALFDVNKIKHLA